MRLTKAGQLTTVALAVFHLNGLLISWGDSFGLPHGLTSARWQMLGALALASQPLSAPQIWASMGVTRQGAQKQLNLLAGEGLVEALPNPMHRRSPLYALTVRGTRIYNAIDLRWQQHVQTLSHDFSTADLDVTLRVLAALSSIYATRPEQPDET
jgi:DNA-binding MarR family transcriptional regulator